MFRYVFREYLYKTLLSSRFLMVSLTMLVALISLFWNMTAALTELGCKVGPVELLPCFLYVDTGMLIYFGVFVFLMAALPRWDGALNQIPRLGKRKWLLIQYTYVFLTSIIYYLFWTICFILAFLPRIDWSNQWSSMMQNATDPEKGFTFIMKLNTNVLLNFSERLVSVGSPGKVYLLTFLLHVLAGTFVGILMVTLNICYRRGTGTLVAYFITGTRSFFEQVPSIFYKKWFPSEGFKQLRNLLKRMEFYISPTYQCDLHIMLLHDARPFSQRLAIGIIYFLILLVLTVIFGCRMVRKIDLCQE